MIIMIIISITQTVIIIKEKEMVATLGRVLLTLTDGLSTRTMGDDGGYNDDDDDEVDDNDDNVDGDDDGDNGDLIEGQEGRKWTSSLRSIFHFMLCKVWGFPLEHQPSANNMRMWWRHQQTRIFGDDDGDV